MTRLGLFGRSLSIKDKGEFVKCLKSGDEIAAMELVAMELKAKGAFIARQLSYADARFKEYWGDLSDEFRQLYDDATALWRAPSPARRRPPAASRAAGCSAALRRRLPSCFAVWLAA